MTLIEKITLLDNVYTQYLGNFINNKYFAPDNSDLAVFHNYNGSINNIATFYAYSVYKSDDYIGDIIIYDDDEVAFKPY